MIVLVDRSLNNVIVQCWGGVRVVVVQTRSCGTCMIARALLMAFNVGIARKFVFRGLFWECHRRCIQQLTRRYQLGSRWYGFNVSRVTKGSGDHAGTTLYRVLNVTVSIPCLICFWS